MAKRKETAPAEPRPEPVPVEPPPPASQAPRAEAARLGVLSLGVAVGLTAAAFVFLIGIAAWLFEWGVGVVAVLSSLYIGYSPSIVGAVAGAVWAFVDGFAAGVVVAYLYNRLLHSRR